MKKLLLILALLWGGGAAGVWYWNESRGTRVSYRTVAVRRGDLRATINATGTMEPEQVVDVDAQVAGQVRDYGTDPAEPSKPIGHGSIVEPGTILAHLDASLFHARVDQAKGNLAKAQADVLQSEAKLRQSDLELDRAKRLNAKAVGFIAQQELDSAISSQAASRAALAVSQGAVAVAKADLEEATVNLGYTTIKSPVKGVILDRRINVGQTVGPTMGSPTLFLIAKDLSRMEIWSSVNENDIGSIHHGQPVRFTVGALAGQTFEGTVKQIRLNASMVSNVVTYTVVIGVENPSGKLLPYLTARLEFEVEGRQQVLLVPNAALRWRPRPKHVAPDARAAYEQSLARRAGDPPSPGSASASASSDRIEPLSLLWIKAGEFVRPIEAKVGLSDGAITQVEGRGIDEGLEVVIGSSEVQADADALSILPHARTGKK